jgi:glucose-1-phosphate thymidylyltransferase
MSQTLKIAVPMAGYGSRLRPLTWSKPKALLQLAGKTVLDYVLEQFNTLPDQENVEFVFIVGPFQLAQVQKFVEQNYPNLKVHFTVQESMRGQSDALWQAREYLSGPMLMVFSDTLVDADFSVLENINGEAIAWVKEVPDPHSYGVTLLDEQGNVCKLVEKPTDLSNRLAVVGFYYFPSAEDLLAAIQQQMEQNRTLNNEFFLVDAINIMLDRGLRMRPIQVGVWLDAGKTNTLLETNQYMLEKGNDNSAEAAKRPGIAVIPPVFIHPEAQITSSVIGPYVSIGRDCSLEKVIVNNSIIDEGTTVSAMVLENSLLGRDVQIRGRATCLNLGDNSASIE